MINREGYFVGEFERECTNCGVIFPKTSKTVTMCNSCNSNRVKNESVELKMLRRAKNRAKVRNVEFDLSLEDITVPTHCPILGIELVMHRGRSGGQPNSPALDRVDNNKGYVKGNVMVISHLANMMKSSATKEQLKLFAKWVFQTYGDSSNEVAYIGEHK
jgi:predicted  nucleic acid-binding Zn-ribbon protein